ncbi:tape measure protein [Paenibacillus sp. SI8]|uniref:tape measure protein n=1 Tax=unclassified Paenibacillus TaxID=185978 RepID=UPI003465C97E
MSFDLVAKLKLTDNFTGPLRKATRSMSELNSSVSTTDSLISRAAHGASGLANALRSAGSSAGTSFGKVAAGAGAAITAFKALDMAKSGLDKSMTLSSDAATASIAFETMLKDAGKARQFIADMTDFAGATPFGLDNVRDSSKKLLAFGFDVKKVLPMLNAIGDASAGLGLGGDGVDRISRALGQMKAKAKVSSDEMLQLTEAGVNGWDILAKRMNVSTAEVMKLSEKGLIPADKAISALIDGMNEQFGGMMSKMAGTTKGLRDQLSDTFDNKLLVKFGDGIGAAIQPRLKKIVEWVDKNDATIARWGANIERVAESATDAIAQKFEDAARFVKSRYIDNPEFQKLTTFGSQVDFVFKDVESAFDKYMAESGSAKLTEISAKITSTLAASLGSASGPITDAALKIGGSIGAGMLSGLKDSVKNHPILSGMAAGAATPGPWQIKAASGASVLFSGNMMKSWEGYKKLFTTGEIMDSETVFGEKKYLWGKPDKPDGSYAGGLDRVPNNGFIARLHKDERVQTKAEADQTRAGRGGNNSVYIAKIAEHIHIRNDSDIEAIADKLSERLRSYRTVLLNG